MQNKSKQTAAEVRQGRMQAAIKELEKQKKENLKKANTQLNGCLSTLILFVVLVIVLPAAGVLVLIA